MAITTPRLSGAAIYVRVSTSKQEEDGTSLDTQEAACRAYCTEQGYPVLTVYREVHTGAELFERRELTALRDQVRRCEVGTVVAYALDRLTRNQAHLGVILSEADHVGTAVELVTERLEDTPEGRLLQSVRGFVAEVERLKIAERTQRGRRARAEGGRPLPGWKPPYGYRWGDAAKSHLLIDEPEAVVVRRIFREAVSGTSLRAIVRGLHADGIPSPAGCPWWPATTIHQILRLPTYVGEPRAFRKQIDRSARGKRTQELRPDAEQIVLPAGVAPPLIERAVQEAVIARLERNKLESVRRNHDPEALLLRAGFARCGYCGSSLVGYHSRGKGWSYTCSKREQREHGSLRILAPILDRGVWERVEGVLRDPEIIAAEVERQRFDPSSGADLAILDRRLAMLEGQRRRAARAVVALADDEASAPLLAELATLAAQQRELQAERAELEARQAGWQADQDRLADVVGWCERVAANLPRLTYAQKRDALTALDVKVRVWRTDHTPRWEVTMRIGDIVSITPRQSDHGTRHRRTPCRHRSSRRPSRRCRRCRWDRLEPASACRGRGRGRGSALVMPSAP
jgi:site-specific DNA recombinase